MMRYVPGNAEGGYRMTEKKNFYPCSNCKMAFSDMCKTCELTVLENEQNERSKGCEFCRTVYVKGDWADGGAHDFRLDKGVLYYHDAQFGWEGIRVNNCPMCGRRLK